jgi:hypothetical protein
VLQLEEAQKETKPFITDLIERNGKETKELKEDIMNLSETMKKVEIVNFFY